MSTRGTVEAFVEAINSGNADEVAALMSEDHVFVDSLGNRIEGRGRMAEGWRFYFAAFPDYRLAVEGMMAEGEEALLHGSAGGTLHRGGRPVDGGRWEIPAAWRALVRGGSIAFCQVFADSKPVYALLERER